MADNTRAYDLEINIFISSPIRPIIKLADKLLLIGLLQDEELLVLLKLIDPENFDPDYDPGMSY